MIPKILRGVEFSGSMNHCHSLNAEGAEVA